MDDDNVLISVSEEELIVSLYQNYLITHDLSHIDFVDARITVKAFSDYIQAYLVDRYNLDEEETDA